MNAAPGHVLFVAPSAYPLGGLATWLDYLLPGLEAKGWLATLGLAAGRFHDPERYLLAHPWHRVVRIPCRTGSREGRVRALEAAIAQLTPDLVASVNIPDSVEAAARRRAEGQPVRAVLTMHGIQQDLVADAARCARMLDAVVCANRLAAELVTRTGSFPERVFYAPCGVAASEQLPDREPRGEILRLLYAGRLEHEQKRVLDVVPILSALDARGARWRLTIAGSGPAEAELRDHLAAAGLRGRVDFLGSVAHADLLDEVLPQADVLLITSLWETGPIVAWEAMAAGVVVASGRYIGSGQEASLRDEQNCLLLPLADPAAAAARIERLRDPLLFDRLRAGGLALVRARYTHAHSVAAWDSALRRIGGLPVRVLPPLSPAPAAGRLDHLLGTGSGERLRHVLGRSFTHAEPGGEWPHSYSLGGDPQAFWDHARAVDGV